MQNALVKVADASPTRPSRHRLREEVVASYWQRYCAKNDTIGFYGPLAWGRVHDDAPALAVTGGLGIAERSVHLEAWGVQALAEVIDPALRIPTGPRSEDDLRAVLAAHPDAAVRERGLAALERLVAARDALAAAGPGELAGALAGLDATFTDLTERDATRNAGRAYGARTLVYLDCMRDLHVAIGPPLVADLAPALQLLFEAARWYCGRVARVGREVIEAALPAGGRGPFGPMLGQVLMTLMRVPPQVDAELAELQRRFAAVVEDPDPATIGARAAAAFADHEPAWRRSVYQSADIQIAARDIAAVAAGDHLAVIGDVHVGANPLVQGVFAHRHPDVAAFARAMAADAGTGHGFLMPPWGPGLSVDARGVALTADDDVHIAPDERTTAAAGRRTWRPDELVVDGRDVVDRVGELRLPLEEAFAMPIFVSGVRTFELFGDAPHAPRLTIGRTVVRRETWNVAPAQLPSEPGDLAAFARERGMPRRVFAKAPQERKPMYLDTESAVLSRILCRHARRAAEEAPGEPITFTEMLPGVAECWLGDSNGERYAAELRVVGVDRTRVASPSV